MPQLLGFAARTTAFASGDRLKSTHCGPTARSDTARQLSLGGSRCAAHRDRWLIQAIGQERAALAGRFEATHLAGWDKRIKRFFDLDREQYLQRSGALEIGAVILQAPVSKKILTALGL